MPSEIYEVVAQGARYWFVFLMALIVWRSYRWYRRDRKQRKKRLRLLPDAGYVGEMVILSGGGELERGAVLPVPREGTLGFLRTNDLCVPAPGVAKKHLWFRFDDGDGLMVEPYRGKTVRVDCETFKTRREPLYMAHGSRLYVGGTELRLRLFAGFEAAVARRPFADDVGEDDAREDTPEAAAARQLAMQQMWMHQQMMRQFAQQQAYQQWAAQQWTAQNAGVGTPSADQPGRETTQEEDIPMNDGTPAASEIAQTALSGYEQLAEDGDGSDVFGPPADASAMDFAPVVRGGASMPDAGQTVFETDDVFYPPMNDDADEAWPYASFPQSDAKFESHGYTYPEYVEPDEVDEDMTDAAAPPKSVYIGHDEAELAKKKLWDKYLGGGVKR